MKAEISWDTNIFILTEHVKASPVREVEVSPVRETSTKMRWSSGSILTTCMDSMECWYLQNDKLETWKLF